jgi:hypothetical protein
MAAGGCLRLQPRCECLATVVADPAASLSQTADRPVSTKPLPSTAPSNGATIDRLRESGVRTIGAPLTPHASTCIISPWVWGSGETFDSTGKELTID